MDFEYIKRYCRENNLFDYVDATITNPILVMVSGGSDSIALLHILARGELGSTPNMRVLHVNHGIRPGTADRDEKFTVELCQRLNIPCNVFRTDVATFANTQGLNLEDAGRRLRYHEATVLLNSFCRELQIPFSRGRIVSGHMADENVETFLMRLIAGSGLRGLAGIPVRRENIIRPLLTVSKKELQEYLVSIGEEWMEDETNLDTNYERAWVRHKLLPQLLEKNSNFSTLLSRNMQVLREEEELLSEITNQKMESAIKKAVPNVELLISLSELRNAVPALQRRVLKLAITNNFSSAERLESQHIFDIISHIDKVNYQCDITGGLRVKIEAEYISVLQISTIVEPTSVEGESEETVDIELKDNSTFVELSDGMTLKFSIVDFSEATLTEGPDVLYLPLNRVGKLSVTGLKMGDRFSPFGTNGTKKVTRFLRDMKVTPNQRRSVRVLRNNEDIAWLIGIRSSENYRVVDNEQLLRVEVSTK